MKGSEQYRLPSRSLDHSTATTTGATHDATPSHANQRPHKHSGVDRRNSRNQQNDNHTPSPSTPTLVEDLEPKAAQRLTVPRTSVDTLCILLFRARAFTSMPPEQETGTTKEPG